MLCVFPTVAIALAVTDGIRVGLFALGITGCSMTFAFLKVTRYRRTRLQWDESAMMKAVKAGAALVALALAVDLTLAALGLASPWPLAAAGLAGSWVGGRLIVTMVEQIRAGAPGES
jgi:hypothetical protein